MSEFRLVDDPYIIDGNVYPKGSVFPSDFYRPLGSGKSPQEAKNEADLKTRQIIEASENMGIQCTVEQQPMRYKGTLPMDNKVNEEGNQLAFPLEIIETNDERTDGKVPELVKTK